MTNRELIDLAIKARGNAISPTKYMVGAAIETANGNIFTGCNLGSEDALYDICAERVAICKMLSEGEKSIKRIAVVGGLEGEALRYTSPCGICRQLILEFGNDIDVIMGWEEDGEIKEQVVKSQDLLPGGYSMN